MKKISTKKMVILAMLTALSYILVMFVRTPLLPNAMFLDYSPSDVTIALSGMIFGVGEAIILAIAVSVLELITISSTGVVGLVMNILSTVAFAVPIAIIYRFKKVKKIGD